MNVAIIALLLSPMTGRDTVPLVAPKYGLSVAMPAGWMVVQKEEEDRVFVASIPGGDPGRPGVLACELGLAPESLDEYRTRIDAGAKRDERAGSALVRNELVKDKDGERLETLREFRPGFGGVWRELTVRRVANRQMYAFILNVDEVTYPAAKAAFAAVLASAKFTRPDTGADPAGAGRWVQREFKFAMGLPEGWSPVLAPTEVALFYANGPAHGVWADNVLVVARPRREVDLRALAGSFPDALRKAEPGCEVVACGVVRHGKGEALETVVRTTRGPFSMSVLERRFRGDRFDYEVKFTVETKRFDAMAPAIRASLDGFAEVPGFVPKGGAKPA